MMQYLERIYGPDKLEFAKNNIRKELDYLKLCEGEYSLLLIDELEHQDCFNIVTELWDTTLEKHVINLGGVLTIKEIKEIFSKLNIGFREMYNNDIIHGDLNLKNILVKYKEDDIIIPKISNYGKKILFNEKLGLMHCDTYYSAPELLSGEKYNHKIDLWSIGIMLYRLFFGEFPYKGKTQVAIYNQIKNQVPIKKRGNNDIFDDLISKLLRINPNQRMDWDEYFSHEFWSNKEIEEDSESEENELNDENLNNNASISNKKIQNNNIVEINQKVDENLLQKRENEQMNNKIKFNIFYSLNNEDKSVQINNFSINRIAEEFPVVMRNKLKKMEILLNKEELEDNNNNPTQEKTMNIIPKSLLSELLLNNLMKKIQNKNIFKLILYGCNLCEIGALNKPSFENLNDLDLSNNLIDNLEIFTKSTFKNLLSLNLNHNRISALDPLKKASFKFLTNLSLTNNQITNIETLSKVPFKNLDKLNLASNLVKDLEIFKNVPFKNLTYLNISDNQINDEKSFLNKINLPNLLVLDLSHNNISDISGLISNQYQNIQMLNLGKNYINNIEMLSRAYFIDLRILLLYDNQISDIIVLNSTPLSTLSYLNLSYNEISDINVFNNVPFSNLEKLDLSGNIISNIDPLLKMPILNLRELYIKNNKIEDNMFNQNVFEEMKKKYNFISIN